MFKLVNWTSLLGSSTGSSDIHHLLHEQWNERDMDVPLQFVGISWVIEGADNIDSSDMLLAIGFMGVSRLSSGDDGPSDRYVQVMNLTI